nr:glycosyltransferase family 39 protein [uncultured Eisenbergiella sp.]
MEYKREAFIGRLTYICSWLILGGGIIAVFGKAIWADEAFSIRLSMQPVKDIIVLTAHDVHPPLYYLILKIGIWIGTTLLGVDILLISKAISAIPYILLLIIWGTVVRKKKGIYYTGITALLLVCMPNFLNYGIEVRMYSWALLFVVISYIYSFKLIINYSYKNWIIFILSCILAAYTHYFAAVAAAIIYVYLFFKSSVALKRKLCIICGGIAAILYLPWMLVVFEQMKTVKESYWIQNLTLADIKGFLYYAIAPPVGIMHADEFAIILTAVIGLSGIAILAANIKNKKETLGIAHALLGCAVLLITLAFGIIVSVLYKPVFVNRYMIPSLCCFWIGIGGILYEIRRKKSSYILLILLIPCCILNVFSFIKTEVRYSREYAKLEQAIDRIEEDDLVVSDSAQIMYSLTLYLKNEGIIWDNKENEIYNRIFPEVSSVKKTINEVDYAGIKWIVQGETGSELLERFEEQGYHCELVGDYCIKWIKFKLYKVSS